MIDSFLFSPASLPFHFQTLQSRICFAYFAPPFVMLPNLPGPWTLDKVKNKLRAEQVQREKAAAARYRRQEEKKKDRETQIGKTSTQCSLLLVLTLCCLLLSLTVLVLSSVVLTLAKK